MTVKQTLDGHRGSLSLHDRMLAVDDTLVRLDHVLCSQEGAFLIQERSNPTDADLDAVRRTAEALELVVVRPIEPTVVVGDAETSAHSQISRRGVKVLNTKDFDRWVADLNVNGDRGRMVVTNARVEKVTEDWSVRSRIPEWEVQARLRPDGVYAIAPEEKWSARSSPGRRRGSDGNPPERPLRRRLPRSSRWLSGDGSALRRAAQVVAVALVVGLVLLLVW